MGGRPPQVIVLAGGSSSGKSSIARALQRLLGPEWLFLGVDDLVEAMTDEKVPGAPLFVEEGGQVVVNETFHALERAWRAGLAAMARAGARIILEDVFLEGASSMARLTEALAGIEVLLVGVRCDPRVAADRERQRGDRAAGMAARQAGSVHAGVSYDLEVDSTRSSPAELARRIALRAVG